MKNIFKNKRNILMIMFALVVIMGIGFAAYSQRLMINDTSSIDSNWDVYIKSVTPGTLVGGATGSGTVDNKTTANLTTDLKYPGDSIEYTITVANDGNIDAEVEKVELKPTKENTVIKYSIIDEANIQYLNSGDEKTFKVKVEYDPTKTGTATTDQKSNSLTLTVDYVQKGTGSGTYVPGGSTAADKLIATVVDTGDGLYEDITESGRYIYKGASPSNYITFNNEAWRIMSVESDNTIKIIRNESIGNKAWDESNSNNWTRPATLNTYLNGEYLGTINEDSKYIVDHTFNVGTSGNSYSTEDIATSVTQEAKITWNGKIGLMTITEILKTTSNTTCTNLAAGYYSDSTGYCNTNNWLWPTLGWLWTISPYLYDSDHVWGADPDGFIGNGSAHDVITDSDSIGVLPVLYLTSDIQLDGEGSPSEPYNIVSK